MRVLDRDAVREARLEAAQRARVLGAEMREAAPRPRAAHCRTGRRRRRA